MRGLVFLVEPYRDTAIGEVPDEETHSGLRTAWVCRLELRIVVGAPFICFFTDRICSVSGGPGNNLNAQTER